MPELFISMFTVLGALTIGRVLLKQPIVLLSAMGIASFYGPTLPTDALAQLKEIVENPTPAVDVESCTDEDAASCIISENQRYATQIEQLHDVLLSLVEGMVPLPTSADHEADIDAMMWES